MSVRLEGRNGAIWRLYVQGHTQEALGERFGISGERVCQIIKAIRENIPEPDRAELRQSVHDAINQIQTMASDLAEIDPLPAYSYGREIPDGKDYSLRIAAGNLQLKALADKRKLFGLDAPSQAELLIHGEDEATKLLAREAVRRLNGDDVETAGMTYEEFEANTERMSEG